MGSKMDSFPRAASFVGCGFVIALLTACALSFVPQADSLLGSAANDNRRVRAANDNEILKAANDNRAVAHPVDPVAQDVLAQRVTDQEKALLNYIAKCEGTANQANDGYSTSLDYGRWLPRAMEQDLTVLTLDQIEALQTVMLSHPKNAALYAGGGSSAIGRYQIVRRTLRGLKKQLSLPGDQLFDAALQDRLGLHLARQRGASRSLGDEWASLTGKKLEEAISLASRAFGPRD